MRDTSCGLPGVIDPVSTWMLPARHAALNRRTFRVDNSDRMSPSDNIQSNSSQDGDVTPQAKLAHELANLLDGSLRNLGLVMSNLRDIDAPGSIDDDLVQRLDIADDAMKQMAQLLRRWMAESRRTEPIVEPPPQQTRRLHQKSESLGQVIDTAVRLLSAAAASQQININLDVLPEINRVPAGPLYPVITNALRNAIEAIASCAADDALEQREIELHCGLDDDTVELTICDTGRGVDEFLLDEDGAARFGQTTKEQGNGIGLSLARDIAESLGGEVRLSNREEGGAAFVFRTSRVSLEGDAAT